MKPVILALGLAAISLAVSLATPLAAQSPGWAADWPNTDFDTRTVDLSEIMSGGVPRDGIPAIDAPAFLPAARGNAAGGGGTRRHPCAAGRDAARLSDPLPYMARRS